jgi:hypothetical protein
MLAAGAVLALTACSGPPAGVAAEVDGHRITDQQVDDFAKVLCALGTGSQGSGTPSKSARFGALQILVNDQLAAGVADVDSVDQASVSSALQQLAASRDIVPESQRESFDAVAEEYARAQTAILELGRKSLADAGKADATDEEAFKEGDRLRMAYAKKADVEIDPRFATMVDGQLQPSSGSLSVAVSDFARKSAAAQPPADLVSLLPASQKCG